MHNDKSDNKSIFDPNFPLYCTLIAIAAFVIRLAMTIQFVGLNAPPDLRANYDQLDYELFAWRMAEGKGITLIDGTPTARRPPGTSLTLLPVYLIFGRNYAAGRVWFCLLSALTSVVAAWTGRILVDKSTGLLSGLFVAFYPQNAYFAMHFLSETPFGLFVAFASGATILACRREHSFYWACLGGLSWGFAGLLRPNILLVFPLFLPLVLFPAFRGDRKIQPVRQLFVMGCVAALTIAPWVVRNRIVMGISSLSTVNAATFWGAHNDRALKEFPGQWLGIDQVTDAQHSLSGSEVEQSRQMWKYSFEFLYERSYSLPYLTAMKFVNFFSPFKGTTKPLIFWLFAVGWIIAASLFVPGCFIAFRNNRTDAYIVLAPFLAMLITTFIYYGIWRFRDSVAPNFLIFSATTIMYCIRKLRP